MSHTFTNLLTHVLFSTKDRRRSIVPEIKAQLHAYMGGIVRELKGNPLTINGVSDHVHLLVQFPPTLALSEAMGVLKANSSGWVNETFPRRQKFAWQTGYTGFSVSQSNASAVIEYISRQEEHHQKMTFQEELIKYLKRHGIAYDERYIWK
jgi:REP-associated tyrosine transposase